MEQANNNLITTLKEFKDAIGKGDEEKVHEKINWFHQDLERNKKLLCDLYTSGSQSASQTDLILTACRNKQADVLYYLLYETDILDHFPGADFDDTEVQTQRTEAIKHALIGNSFPMVEMLYDYWSGDLHWVGHDINKLITLGKMLEDARVVCAVKYQQLCRDIKSLVTFNAFQQTLYSRISNIAPEETADMIVEVLRIYDEYSEVEKVRIPSVDKEAERKIKEDLSSKESEYMRMHVYSKYEVYFRKLDFNIALLILENWFILRNYFRERFNKPRNYLKENPDIEKDIEKAVSSFKEIECVIYHFLYRTCEDWRLYLAKGRKITVEKHHKGIHEGRIIENLILTYDEHKLRNGPVLFLERKSFNERVKELKSLLENYIMTMNPVKQGAQSSTEKIEILINDNYLRLTMYMTDYYSLKKIVYYIKAIKDANVSDEINVLMIERILQVTGEMLKSTNATYHVSESTKTLLQIAISVDTIQYLHTIRTFFSKADGGQLGTRIAINGKPLAEIFDHIKNNFENIKEDLNIIEERINSVLCINEPFLDIWLLLKGFRLLKERMANLPYNARTHIDKIYRHHQEELFDTEKRQPYLQELKHRTKHEIQLFIEIISIRYNIDSILSKLESTTKTIQIRIIDNHKNGKFDVSDFWDAISKMLSEVKSEIKDDELKEIDVHSVTKIFEELEDKCESNSKCKNMKSSKSAENYSFDDIKKLHDEIKKHSKGKKRQELSRAAREMLLECLIKRVNQLKETLGCQNIFPENIKLLERHHRQYKHDKKFRFAVEMIVADIANVLAQSDIKNITKKSGKLLRQMDLGNLLDHGNPFLDVIGDVFDPYDISTELLSKAIMFAKDGESIDALLTLFKGNIDYETIKEGNLNKMSDDQKTLYGRFQKSPNWESYADLIKEKK